MFHFNVYISQHSTNCGIQTPVPSYSSTSLQSDILHLPSFLGHNSPQHVSFLKFPYFPLHFDTLTLVPSNYILFQCFRLYYTKNLEQVIYWSSISLLVILDPLIYHACAQSDNQPPASMRTWYTHHNPYCTPPHFLFITATNLHLLTSCSNELAWCPILWVEFLFLSLIPGVTLIVLTVFHFTLIYIHLVNKCVCAFGLI